LASLLTELKRRKVYRAAALYAAAAWLLVQIATQVFPFFDLPNWSVRLIILTLVVAFPVAMLVAWFYEWTPRGWRREIEADAPAAPAPPIATEPPTDQSIAVLPFADMSERRDQEYFSDGLAEELLNLLAQLAQLRVISRTSSFSFKGRNADVRTIARALHVAYVLEGSVRKSGNALRVTAQLIRAADGSHIWAQTFNRELTDVFAVQDEIAGAVVAALKARLLPGRSVASLHRTASSEAHDQFLLGQAIVRRGRYDDWQRALATFQRAIDLDPGYAAAYAGLATAQSGLADFADNPQQSAAGKQQALASAEKAISLAPDLPAGYAVRASLRYRRAWDWEGAVADFRRALALEPGNSDVLMGYALVLYSLEQIGEALATIRNAIESDPLSHYAWVLYAILLRRSDRTDEGRAAFARALEISPNSSIAHFLLGQTELEQGNVGLALEHFQLAGESFRQTGIAMAEHTLGHAEASQAALDELEGKYATGFAYQIAQVHAWRGDKDAAFAWLDRACTQFDSGMPRLRSDTLFSTWHDDPRYAALLRRLNFPEAAT
jgi:TolB-like protein/Tfp pilus assembly protein PilF